MEHIVSDGITVLVAPDAGLCKGARTIGMRAAVVRRAGGLQGRPAAGVDRASALDGGGVDQHHRVANPGLSWANIAVSQSIVSVRRWRRFQWPGCLGSLGIRCPSCQRERENSRSDETFIIACETASVTTSASLTLRLALLPLGQEIVSGGEHRGKQQVEVGEYRGPLRSTVTMRTPDFDLVATSS
jgi:hypothetical protein